MNTLISSAFNVVIHVVRNLFDEVKYERRSDLLTLASKLTDAPGLPIARMRITPTWRLDGHGDQHTTSKRCGGRGPNWPAGLADVWPRLHRAEPNRSDR